ncbi:MAG: hypothetical protein Q9209_004722 [Squamulea sp. 1 TL-2023]
MPPIPPLPDLALKLRRYIVTGEFDLELFNSYLEGVAEIVLHPRPAIALPPTQQLPQSSSTDAHDQRNHYETHSAPSESNEEATTLRASNTPSLSDHGLRNDSQARSPSPERRRDPRRSNGKDNAGLSLQGRSDVEIATSEKGSTKDVQTLERWTRTDFGAVSLKPTASEDPGFQHAAPTRLAPYHPLSSAYRSQQPAEALSTSTLTPDDVSPEGRYIAQLRRIREMSSYDSERNLRALKKRRVSAQGAVDYLGTEPHSQALQQKPTATSSSSTPPPASPPRGSDI